MPSKTFGIFIIAQQFWQIWINFMDRFSLCLAHMSMDSIRFDFFFCLPFAWRKTKLDIITEWQPLLCYVQTFAKHFMNEFSSFTIVLLCWGVFMCYKHCGVCARLRWHSFSHEKHYEIQWDEYLSQFHSYGCCRTLLNAWKRYNALIFANEGTIWDLFVLACE